MIIKRVKRTSNIDTMVDVTPALKCAISKAFGSAVGYASAQIAGISAIGTVSN